MRSREILDFINETSFKDLKAAFDTVYKSNKSKYEFDDGLYKEMIRDMKKYLKGDVILYQGVMLTSIKDLDFGKIGISWTYRKDKAIPYWGLGIDKKENTKLFILKSLVPISAIDILGTLEFQLSENPDESEREVRLLPKKTIMIGSYLDGDKEIEIGKKGKTYKKSYQL